MRQLVVKEYTPYVQSVTVHEHKAPTDDSIRIYNEMMEKAQGSILHSIKIDNNTLKAVYVVLAHGGMFNQTIIKAKFTLNGIEHSYTMDADNYILSKHDSVVQVLYEKLSQLIAQELVRDYMNIRKNNLI